LAAKRPGSGAETGDNRKQRVNVNAEGLFEPGGRCVRHLFANPYLTAILVGALLALSGNLSFANDSRYRDRVEADSFGNLVIYSAAGYKRIIVGQGHRAAELQAFVGDKDEPSVVYLDQGRIVNPNCPHAVLLKGRSYMYGLPDGVVPEPACRN
jgi:hypothetical protein